MSDNSNVGGFVIVVALVGVALLLYARGTFNADPGAPAPAEMTAPAAQPPP